MCRYQALRRPYHRGPGPGPGARNVLEACCGLGEFGRAGPCRNGAVIDVKHRQGYRSIKRVGFLEADDKTTSGKDDLL